MKPLSSQPEVTQIVEVDWADRWQIYHRLQELNIKCWCATDQPLIVDISDVATVIQLWSVSRQFITPRQDLVWWLERCWQHRA